MTRRRRHPLIWLALAAMLAVALLPTVSHALAHARGVAAAAAEVCTSQGLRRVPLQTAAMDQGAAPVPAALPLAHCPLCTLAADHPGLPPAAPQAGLRLPFDDVRLPARVAAPHALPTCRIAQPRGPPAGA